MEEKILLHHLPLNGLRLIQRKPMKDPRGHLERMYCQRLFVQHGLVESIAQINLTLTKQMGTVRGMHFQHPPHAEDKIVTCLRGRVFDVAVDLRHDSPTFLKWHAEILSPELNNSLLIPKGFAHGFQALTSDCELLYFHTAFYHPAAEGGISPIDPQLNIQWPLAITDMSDRDKNHALLTTQFMELTHAM